MKQIEGPRGRIYPDHSPKRVALIGMGPSFQDYLQETMTQELTPEHHDEVWGINMIGNALRCDGNGIDGPKGASGQKPSSHQ